jgi:diacylglycerol kinase
MKQVSKDKKKKTVVVEENKKSKVSIIGFIKTNKYSIEGLINYFKNETSAIRLLIAWVIQITLIILLKPEVVEVMIIFICMTLILSIELINTAIEAICDLVSPEYNKLIKIAKDSASAATYIFSWVTGFISLYIFLH